MGANLSEVGGSPLNNPPNPTDDDVGHARERKRRWWRRRTSRQVDPGRPLREMLAGFSIQEVLALVHDYDTLAKEKELYIHSESARPRAPTIRSDLADLLDFKWNSDVNLILPPAIFPAHRPILMQRSKYFRSLLHHHQPNVTVDDVDIPTFSQFVRFLYTEETSGDCLETVFGRPIKSLEADLRELLQTSKYSDVVVVVGEDHIPCHKSILAARSGFFRSLFQRRGNSKTLVLDESVIPKRYARVILNCMYTDRVDLQLIDPARSGLTEVESLTFTGRVNPAGFEEAMELYQIGKFIEFEHLSHTAEDIIIEQLTYESLTQVLKWSGCPHGSAWVRRQAMMFLREEFLNFTTTTGFLELDRVTLTELIQSDFLQASEVDILQSVLRWGENQLVRRIEDREPNLLTTTPNSVSRKGIKRRDLSDSELREILHDLLLLVRTDHILLNNEVLVQSVRRGLLSIPPSHMLTEEKSNPWLSSSPTYIPPRLYTPFYEEAKASLRHRATTSMGDSQLSLGRRTLRSIPDTLYMLDKTTPRVGGEEVAVDPELLQTMQLRLKKLQSSHHHRSVAKEKANSYLKLRVVREFGMPDYVAEHLDPTLLPLPNPPPPTEQCGAVGVEKEEQRQRTIPDIALTSEQFRLPVEEVMDLDLGDGHGSRHYQRGRGRGEPPPTSSSSTHTSTSRHLEKYTSHYL